ncbi:MAG: mannose-1-phosphate guanylyltransferase/mannose-6-phosphate isomerase [Gammaproteobacteria bacterium]|nr:mannose-1-phosphate guanylyltransferase/mannose-6-phosphate isomerase [Gammaproteobacteria bacterium]
MLIPIILSGGAGTRLWPVSREGHPKPFMKLPDGQSLLEKTYRRAAEVVSKGEVITVTNRDYYFMSKDEYIRAKVSGAHGVYLLEPMGRNTAPAIALAALHVREKYGDNALMLVMAADHLINDTCHFVESVTVAKQLAQTGMLVTFGIRPNAPETGFGYIESGEALGDSQGHAVKRFVEKPDLDTARSYLEAGNYLWNSGMFCFTAGTILEELEQHAPEVMKAVFACFAGRKSATVENSVMCEFSTALFEAMPDISIDYAVMEKSERVAVVPALFEWSDIGSWDALGRLVEPDNQQNRIIGDAVLVDTKNTYIQTEGRVVAAVGIDDLIIVDTDDALLVTRPGCVQDVKKVVHRLKTMDHEAYRLHRTVYRPWGTYTVLEQGNGFKIKRIEVKPGAALSMQIHHHRSEHWIVVRGMAKVINGDNEIFINTNESTYIPAGHKHRLENPGLLSLILIEVQSGEYLGEDDIVRFDDNYGRTTL